MGKRIYVGNLPWSTTSADLQQIFGEYGSVTSAEVVMDRATGRSRGFGFVEMESGSDADSAIEALNNSNLNNRSLVVNEARERAPRSGGGGRYGGGGGYGSGGGYGGQDR